MSLAAEMFAALTFKKRVIDPTHLGISVCGVSVNTVIVLLVIADTI